MLRVLIFLLSASLFTPAMADERAQTEQQLQQARKDVAELQKLVQKLQKEKSALQQELRKTETEMGQLQRQISELQLELERSKVELERLGEEQQKLQKARVEQQRLIAIQARAAYQGGQQEPLRLLLNQQQPETFTRTLTYYEYLGKARLQQLETFNETLRQLTNIELEIAGHQRQLDEQKVALEQRRKSLEGLREQRRLALAKLDKQHKEGDRKLKTRQQEQAELAAILKTIEETLARQAQEAELARQEALAGPQATPLASGPQVSSAGGSSGPFTKARGKLPWPVDGRLVARFGTPRGDARSKWDGVMISAPAGTPVRAVHAGRVVFADWLRGAGLLVIIDHGDGYLSLYGHNQSLLKNPGDLVEAGDSISTVGNSGGQTTPALYFAIRQQGKPANPALWCRAQG
jgi:septal ring factor EnvC (AmiA/AmiB activator)